MRAQLKALWPLGAAIALALPVPLLNLHFIRTESAPIGLWRAHSGAPVVGDVVRFCMREAEARTTAGRPYAGGRRRGPCPHGTWMLAKPVVAGAGDTVIHTQTGVWINGWMLPRSGTRPRDSAGWPVPASTFGLIVLGPGEVWLHSPYAEGSFDSRYLGVVRRDQISGTMQPLLTWLTDRQRSSLRARGLRPTRCGPVACVQRSRLE
ncbi:S26 family signal peptidase [Longimicrobium terrae]|uniref:S26 family signal peptidase n=1 Tax=Longimicrobium terrae TaxID=1639882 RepID=UPI0014739B88|nr:hypothetical protein [Longimicrobium terrae]